ncbi:MAG: membrane-bound lytic murein transglycosylase B [Myxococcota bacterium]|jgi:membrane-bound lytic murein transglycosylase B
MFAALLCLSAIAIPPVDPVLATSPVDIAAQLVRVESTLRDPAHSADADLLTYGHLQQVIYRALVHDTATASAVLAALPQDTAAIAQTNIDATRAIMGTVGKKRVNVPAWRIVQPAGPDELVAHYQAAEGEYGVQWEVLAAIHLVETRMGRLRGVSTAGAAGPMQFIPETWARFGEGNIEDNRDAIMAAARHLTHHGAPGNTAKALWHYNPTDRYVTAVQGYASLIEADPLAFRGYYGWEVYYQTIAGTVLLPVGYAETAPIPVRQWCAEMPSRCP